MIDNKEMQLGKAGEYITCADIIMKGLVAYPSEQGLPYDVVIDTGDKLLKCQVKTTEKPRVIPQRSKETHAYIFNVKRNGKRKQSRYKDDDVDVFALVEMESRTVAYIKNCDMPATINIRVDKLRGSYYDEKGVADYIAVKDLKSGGMSQTEIAEMTGLHFSSVSRMLKPDFIPHKTKARYFSDYAKGKDWFCGL